MKKTTRRKPQNETLLEDMVRPEARRQAESLGVPLEAFITALATKCETMAVTLRFTPADIRRLNQVADGGRIHEWCESTLRDCLDLFGAEGDELANNRITLTLQPKVAERLREAAKFEEMSVEEYLKDGLRRDLDLTGDLMQASKN